MTTKDFFFSPYMLGWFIGALSAWAYAPEAPGQFFGWLVVIMLLSFIGVWILDRLFPSNADRLRRNTVKAENDRLNRELDTLL